MPLQNDQYWEFLGSTELVSAAVTTGALTIAARQSLLIAVTITGFSAGESAALRFNADSGANYSSRFLSCAIAGVTLVDNPSASAALARVHFTAQTLGVAALVHITNPIAASKVGSVSCYLGTGAAATVPPLNWGGFEWVNTTAQIVQIELRTVGGVNTLSAGSGFSVYGRSNL